MSATNPELQGVERPAYELQNLFTRLGQPRSGSNMTAEQANIAGAIKTHASNAAETILDGIESIGQLMTMAGLNDQYTLDRRHIVNLGQIIAHLAVEAQTMEQAVSDMGVLLAEKHNRGAA